MNKISISILLLVLMQNSFCQETYWSFYGHKDYYETYKTAFVTTQDQEHQFIVKHYKNGDIELLFITSRKLFEKSIVRFQFDESQFLIQGNIRRISDGVFKFTPFIPNDDDMFIRSNDKKYLKIEDIITYLKKYNKFRIYVNSTNQYSTKEYNYYFTLKDSSVLLAWALSPDFDWDVE